MKAEELRIGNIIKTVGGRLPYWEVTFADFEPISENPENYQPIPLTEEWLLKFGFEKRKDDSEYYAFNGFYLDSDYIPFTMCNSSGIWDCYAIKQVYVHQLQNLYFALTGEELKIKTK